MTSWLERESHEHIATVTQNALTVGLVQSADRSCAFHNLSRLKRRIAQLRGAFPPQSLHAIAIKANPLVEVLRVAVSEGAGLEAASIEEVHIALAANCPPERIVFDSPAKTHDELVESLHLGLVLNADNFAELERIDGIVTRQQTRAAIGLRINPMVGAGGIAITSVADATSKFGVRLDTDRERIIQAFKQYPWLSGIHIHVGSQGCDLPLLLKAAIATTEFAAEVNEACGQQRVNFLDIGGGLPALYETNDNRIDVADYANALREHAPLLFSNDIRIMTEFGRAIQAGCGFAVSRVEYVKTLQETPLAVIHLGADMFMRPVYLPHQWRHEYIALDSDGRLKTDAVRAWTIAGPLCFAGDILAKNVQLPNVSVGDYVAVLDTGAYTLSMWSRHCSRGMPTVLGYHEDPLQFSTLRKRETPADIVRYWSA